MVSIDCIVGDDGKHLAIVFAQRADGVDVATAKAVTDAIKARPRAHQQGFSSSKDFH